jgi:hypothetical protein
MNQFFSFKRFSLLVMKHWADNRRRYVLSVFAFIGLLITWFVFTMLMVPSSPMPPDMQYATFYGALFTVGSFYANHYFRELGSKAKASNFLLVPASSFEKILCAFLFSVLLFFIVFTAAYYLVDMLMVAISNSFVKPEGRPEVAVVNVFQVFDQDESYVLISFFAVQAAFLLGSVYFSKYSFIKTVITGFFVWVFLFALLYLFYENLLPQGDFTDGMFGSYRVRVEGATDQLIQMPEWTGPLFRVLIIYGIAPFLWIVAYYRLKEKQV